MSSLLVQITDLTQYLHRLQERFLQDHGWIRSCEFPDSCWRWVKNIDGKTFVTSFTEAYSLESYIEEMKMDSEEANKIVTP